MKHEDFSPAERTWLDRNMATLRTSMAKDVEDVGPQVVKDPLEQTATGTVASIIQTKPVETDDAAEPGRFPPGP